MGKRIVTFNNFLQESATKKEKEKGKEIVYTFKTKAVCSLYNKKYTHNVYLTEGEVLEGDKFGGLILSIEDTPGSWYVDTLYEEAINYDTMSIYGSSWRCTNWTDIMTELKEYINEIIFDLYSQL